MIDLTALIFTALAIVASIGDAMTTKEGLELGAKEKNPIAAFIFRITGNRPYLFKFAIIIPLMVFAYLRFSIGLYCVVAFLVFATGGYAIANNTGVIQRIIRRKKGL
jgi:hypothetical protein